MRPTSSIKRHLPALIGILFMPTGAFAGTLTAPADSLTVTTDSLPAAGTFAADSLTTDTASIIPPTATPDTTALDTTAIGLRSDSLLRQVPFNEKRFIPNPQRALWLSRRDSPWAALTLPTEWQAECSLYSCWESLRCSSSYRLS